MSLQIDESLSDPGKQKDGGKTSFFSSRPGGSSYFKSLFDDDDKSSNSPKRKPTTRHRMPSVALQPDAPTSNSEDTLTKTSRFLTHSIVGAPHSILLGRRTSYELNSDTGLLIDMKTGLFTFPDSWSDCWVLSHAMDKPGKPKGYPSKLRMYLERRALVIALFGIALSIASVLGQLYLK